MGLAQADHSRVDSMSLDEQIADAQQKVRKLARAAPYLFPEYDRMREAKLRLQQARKEYERARRVWNSLRGQP